MPKKQKPLEHALQAVSDLVDDADKFGPAADYTAQSIQLLRALDELTALQDTAPLRVIDDDVPWDARCARLLAWLRTHPDFAMPVPVELRRDLPAGEGGRGLVAGADIPAGAVVFRVPADAMLSTATAALSVELGPLVRDPRLPLRAMPTVALTLHLMVEHAKAWEARAPAADAPPPDGVYPMPRHGALAAARAAWELQAYGAVLPEDAEEDDDGGGEEAAGGHGHSHGGRACGGHGHGHGGRKPSRPLLRTLLCPELHPWGSHQRPYLSLLPSPAEVRTSLYFGAADIAALRGTPAGPGIADFLRNAAKSYVVLYTAFGPGGDGGGDWAGGALIDGFDKWFTWSHFRWAMSVVMSRQNKVPPDARSDAEDAARGAPPWPAGVPRYGASDPYHLALMPLYDMVNHAPGPLTSFFTTAPPALTLEAPASGVAAGAQVRMSYGSRPADAQLQYQGFVSEDNSDDFTAAEVALPDVMRGAGTLAAAAASGGSGGGGLLDRVSADADALRSDALFRLRVNVLSSLTVAPEHNARAHLRPAVGARMQAAATAAAAAAADATTAQRDAAAAADRVKWSLPFTFVVRPTPAGAPADADAAAAAVRTRAAPGVSHELRSFLRVGCIADKAEAGEALRQAAAARKRVADALAERKRAAAAAGRGGDDDDDDGDDDGTLPPLCIGVLSAANERAAATQLVAALGRSVAALERPVAGVGDAPPLDADAPVARYRALQLRHLADALRAAEEELAALGPAPSATPALV